jgi:hypothetical protein
LKIIKKGEDDSFKNNGSIFKAAICAMFIKNERMEMEKRSTLYRAYRWL